MTNDDLPPLEPFGYLSPTGRHPDFRFTQGDMPVFTADQLREAYEAGKRRAAPTLTDEEIADIWTQTDKNGGVLVFARAIEAALKEKQ
jgi:hypothetical protein